MDMSLELFSISVLTRKVTLSLLSLGLQEYFLNSHRGQRTQTES